MSAESVASSVNVAISRRPRSQTVYLIMLLLKLKRLRFLWLIVVLVAIISNHVILPMINKSMGYYGERLRKMDVAEFLRSSILMMQVHKYKENFLELMHAIKENEGTYDVARRFIKDCNSTEHCNKYFFDTLYGSYSTDSYTTYVDFREPNEVPRVTCQLSYGADLQCPLVGHIVAMSKSPWLFDGSNRYREVQFFSLTTQRTEPSKFKGGSMCASQGFDAIFSRAIMIQALLFILSTMFYFVVGTVKCVVGLKRHGFLNIMFLKGLPIRSYWLAVWSITVLEAVVISLALSMSLFVQCPGNYKIAAILKAFIATFLHLLCTGALALLLTVLQRTLFHISMTMTFISLCSCAMVFVLRIILADLTFLKAAFLFALPLAHIGELILAAMLSDIVPDIWTAYHDTALIVLTLLTITILAMTVYLDFILASGNGLCLKSGYVCDRNFWTPQRGAEAHLEDPLADTSLPDTANFEPMTDGLRPIVRVSQVGKVYSNRFCGRPVEGDVTALKDISVHIYEGQITAIIGHNGSGKTTLLNIMSGILTPTTGQVSVNGILLDNFVSKLRLQRIIGVCTQEDSLCNDLTVAQTISLAQISSGRDPQNWADEAMSLAASLRLVDRMNEKVSKLSKGVLRKLCTAVALIGDAKVLFLDEPTSGVDPLSRRLIWKLLTEYKKKHSIIMCTQAMDEADALADRKVFLSGGAIICSGSSLFLKKAFDCGFDFNVTLKQPTHVPLLIKQIQQDFPQVKVKNKLSASLVFHFPASDIALLAGFAQALERRSSLITAFGLVQASLYDIFMRLQDLEPSEVEKLFKEGRIGLTVDEEIDEKADPEEIKLIQSRISGAFYDEKKIIKPSLVLRFVAIARINALRVFRSRLRLCTRIFAPAFLLILMLVMSAIELGGKNSRIHLRTNITNFGDGFTRGVCLYRQDDKVNRKDQSWCSLALRSERKDSKVENFVTIEIPDDLDIYKFVQDDTNLARIKAACYSKDDPITICPIVFTDYWDKSASNFERRVFFGSFSTFDQHNASHHASVSLGAYTKFSRFILSQQLGPRIKLPDGIFKVIAESVYNFSSTFIPLYGTFLHLVIILLMPATFLDDLMEDRDTKVKNQLFSIGMSDTQYWAIMFILHWIQYAAVYLLSVMLLFAVNSAYANIFYIAGIMLPTLVFGLSNCLLFIYIVSCLIKKSSPIMSAFFMFFSICFVAITLASQVSNVTGVILVALVPPLASIAPTFYGTKAIFYTLSYFGFDDLSAVVGGMTSVYFAQPHIVSSLAALAIHLVLQSIILTLLGNRFTLTVLLQMLARKSKREASSLSDDAGVKREIQRLEEDPRNAENMLEIRHLSVAYHGDSKVVRDITLAVPNGEIFGLLGPNGAGKSTTLSVIVGDRRATEGRCEVQYRNKWMSSRLAAKYGHVGYCPQYNPQYNDITTKEHLDFYARIIGVDDAEASRNIDILMQNLKLDKHKDKTAAKLSFGFKRRLSLAATLLGDPCLLVIDEASTGIDPEGKRVVWKSIKCLASEDHSIVIATNSMEEAEAVCDRVTVMNRGQLVGLGSAQELKSAYGESYTLELLLATVSEEHSTEKVDLVKAVSKKFGRTTVVEEFSNRLTFSIPMSSIGRLSHALIWLTEEARRSVQISYFSFYQTSLDQVFSRMILSHDWKLLGESEDVSLIDVGDEGATSVE